MTLFTLRHEIAANAGDPGMPPSLKDADRPLTAKGRHRLSRSVKAIETMEVGFDVVMCSPLLRAVQTAQGVVGAMKLRRKLVITEALAPGGSRRVLIGEINRLGRRAKNILLVGHEPDLSRLIALLCTGDTSAALELKKGGLAKLKVERLRHARCATLAWLLTPKQLRRMA